MNILLWTWLLSMFLLGSILDARSTPKTYREILETLNYPDKLIFDVTDSVNIKLEGNNPPGFLNQGTLDELEIQLSPILHYKQTGPFYRTGDFYPDPSKPRETIEGISSRAFSFLFSGPPGNAQPLNSLNSTFPVTTGSTEEFLNNTAPNEDKHFTVIFNLERWLFYRGMGEYAIVTMGEQISRFKSTWKNVKVGLDYNLGQYRPGLLDRVLEKLDVVILNFDIHLEQLLLSYPMFKKYLGEKLHSRFYYLLLNEPKLSCDVFAKINFPVESARYAGIKVTDEMYQRYYFYLLQFSVLWVNDGEEAGIILQPFNLNVSNQVGFDGVDLRELLVRPVKLDGITMGWVPINMPACEKESMMNAYDREVLSMFQNESVRVKVRKYPVIPGGIPELLNITGDQHYIENNSCKSSKEDIPGIDVVMIVYRSYYAIKYLTFNTEDNWLKKIKTTVRSIYQLPWKPIPANVSNVDHSKIDRFGFHFPDVIIDCGDERTKLDHRDNSFYKCDFLGQQVKSIVWDIDLNQNFENVNKQDVHDLHLKLIAIKLKHQQFMHESKNKTVTLKMVLGNSKSKIKFDMYCHPKEVYVRAMGRIIISFARIHNILLEIKDMMNYNGWRKVDIIRSISHDEFPLFVNRDYSQSEKLLTDIGHGDQCISWTREIPKDGIEIDLEYAGTTLYPPKLRNGSLTVDELKTLLLFTFHKFSLVEIVPASMSHMETILDVFSHEEFFTELERQESQPLKFYLQVNCNFFNMTKNNLNALFSKVEKFIVKPLGIHFTNWDNPLDFNNIPRRNKHTDMMQVGVSSEDCEWLGNEGRAPGMEMVDYLVCILVGYEASNIDRRNAEQFLDNALYMHKVLRREIFPNISKEIMFRFNTILSKSVPGIRKVEVDGEVEKVERDETSDLITFISDVSQYAKFNKMKIFMIPAFDDVEGGERGKFGQRQGRVRHLPSDRFDFGWWKISDFEDLSNASNYIEKEAEHLGKDSWRPVEPDPDQTTEEGETAADWTKYYIIFAASGLLITAFFCIACILQIQHRKKFALLTKEEVYIFRFGGDEEDGSGKVREFDCRKFPKEFEVPKSRFILWNVIGQGNFGLVYNATLRAGNEDESDTTIAVKIPHPNCPKNSFLSMLSELKVLCYVGSHPHVIEFVGADIKEIGKGMVYIATKLYEHGALQEYLRKRHSDLLKETGETLEELPEIILYELNRFSHEIALGMDYIANKRIAHGDLATRNVLLDSDLRCKIADFGLSKKLYQYEQYVKTNSEPLPWRWMAVETLKRMEFTIKADVWSYGVTLWEIFSFGSLPYPGLSWTVGFADELEGGLRMLAPKFSSNEIYEIMMSCWDIDPEQRPCFNELSQSFANLRNNDYI